jgi:hypothetical protein
MPDQWPEPELISPEEERQYALDIVKQGIRFIIFSVLATTVFLWVVTNILANANVISSSISWLNCGILSLFYVILRVWNSTFFK